ncbi:MAG: type IV pilus twitching motility protein PilT [Chitinispirillaceae bacterium]|nr:type IV pilus twitching motility protein PilT [Chitinispirillaceae bacterium]
MSGSLTMRELLEIVVSRNATDLHLSSGIPPRIRVNKDLEALDFPNLVPEVVQRLCYEVMNEQHQRKLELKKEVDFSFGIAGLSRFRANVFTQRGTTAGAFRRIPFQLLTFEALSLPAVVREISDKPNGITLVTGPTGCGKSTTLAAMIDRINSSRRSHIVTIEDPIEFIHPHKLCLVNQREIGADTDSFTDALKSILRQDPDVVLLGEMRDMESIQAALTIAETGHTCFATLHTNSCSQTISRVVDVFPSEKQQQIRLQLSSSLNGVFTQSLLPKNGGGLQLVCEIMVATPAVRSLIREGKYHHLDNEIQLGARFGMQTMNQSLASAVKSNLISEATALTRSIDIDDFFKCMSR